MLRTLALATMLLLAMPAHGQNFQKGIDAANRGDYATALREWRPLAEAGDAAAQYGLGVMYRDGQDDTHENAKGD